MVEYFITMKRISFKILFFLILNFSKNVDLTRLNIVNGKICFDMQLKHSKTQPILYSFEIDMVKKH